MPSTYTVRAAADITRRGAGHARRRAGLSFGEAETLVSTNPDEPGAVHVTEEQLLAILQDSNLRPADSPDRSTAGLRAKVVTTEKHPEAETEGEPEGEGEKAQQPRRPGRPRKVALES